MSTDFENQLRQQFRGTADAHDIPIDLDAVLDEGHQRLCERNRRWIGGGAAVLTAAAVLGGGVWQGAAKRVEQPAAAPTEARSITIPLDQQAPGIAASIRVRAENRSLAEHSDDGTQVEITGLDAEGRPLGKPQQGSLGYARSAGHIVLDDHIASHCALVLVRGEVSDLKAVTRRTAPTYAGLNQGSLHRVEPELSAQVLCENGVNGRKTDSSTLRAVRGFVWSTPDGGVLDSDGRRVPHAALTLGGEKVLVHLDRELDDFAVRSTDGSLSAYPSTSRTRTQVYGATNDTWWVAGTLPKGAELASVTWKPTGPTMELWQGGELPDGGSFFVARGEAKQDSGKPASTRGLNEAVVSYRTADGRLVSETP